LASFCSDVLLGTGEAVPDGFDAVATAIRLAVLVGYLAGGRGQVVADLRDRTLAPFVPLAAITPTVLATGLTSYAFGAAQSLVVVFTVITIAIGGWLTGQWIVGDLDEQYVHPASRAATNTFAYALAGYALLMTLVQLRFLPRTPGFPSPPGSGRSPFPPRQSQPTPSNGSPSDSPPARRSTLRG
jgi:hypothetical protein